MRNEDHVFVFGRRRIGDSGIHAELLDQDGIYARLVKIQTQVSKDPNVDKLLVHTEEYEEEEKGASESIAPAGPAIRWLDPDQVRFVEKGEHLLASHEDKSG